MVDTIIIYLIYIHLLLVRDGLIKAFRMDKYPGVGCDSDDWWYDYRRGAELQKAWTGICLQVDRNQGK